MERAIIATPNAACAAIAAAARRGLIAKGAVRIALSAHRIADITRSVLCGRAPPPPRGCCCCCCRRDGDPTCGRSGRERSFSLDVHHPEKSYHAGAAALARAPRAVRFGFGFGFGLGLGLGFAAGFFPSASFGFGVGAAAGALFAAPLLSFPPLPPNQLDVVAAAPAAFHAAPPGVGR